MDPCPCLALSHHAGEDGQVAEGGQPGAGRRAWDMVERERRTITDADSLLVKAGRGLNALSRLTRKVDEIMARMRESKYIYTFWVLRCKAKAEVGVLWVIQR